MGRLTQSQLIYLLRLKCGGITLDSKQLRMICRFFSAGIYGEEGSCEEDSFNYREFLVV